MQTRALTTHAYLTTALVIIITLVTAIYALAIRLAMDSAEHQLVTHNLEQALDELVQSYRQDPLSPVISTKEMHRYIVDADTMSGLPRRLSHIPEGITKDVRVDGQRVHAVRLDEADKRLYVTLSIEQLEAREDSLKALLWGAIITGYLLSLLCGWLVARRLARPIIALASQVSHLSPIDDQALEHPRRSLREVETISHAMDDFLLRLSGFIQRERAFTEDASHELRTPLATLLSAIPLLENDCAPGSLADKRLQRIKRAAEQMQALVESLLFLAREEGDLISCRVDVAVLINELVEQARELAPNLHFRLDLTPVKLTLPKGMLVTVISNLLSNAIEHTQSGEIRVCLTATGMTISDTGTGILPDDLEHIFERRYRGANSRGLGLGLYLVKRICDRLKWQLSVNSQPGEGTTFIISFPKTGD